MRDRLTAWHEAGHAVIATSLGLPVRYVTLRPQGGMAGHVLYRDRRRLPWRDTGTVYLAGIAAEQMLTTDRADLIHGGLTDLHNARRVARGLIAWRSRRPTQTDVDPGWSEWDVGAFLWRRAVDMVTANLNAVTWLADLLLASPRAVTIRQIRQVIAGSDPVDDPPRAADAEWWIPRHTRMQWRREVPSSEQTDRITT